MKGVDYSLDAFLGPNNWDSNNNERAMNGLEDDYRITEKEVCVFSSG